MKKLYILLMVFVVSCSKDLNEVNQSFPMLAPANADAGAGSWKTVLLINKDNFTPAIPADVNSTAYKNELNAIADLQKSITVEDNANLKYWGAGGVLRWNEILRELVAKYNLAPVNNPDGSYPIPSAANPLAYPFFPFANPPYAARSYAYVSVAQYDALVTAHAWKSTWNRQPAYKLDNRIKALLPDQGIAAYPSADAVIYAAAGAMLKLMFPGEINYINEKMAQHRKARLLSGLETSSDLDAGEVLGNSVAQLHITRARNDRAGAAVGIVNGTNLWKEFETSAIARNEIPWISQESPKRPPMLP